MIKTRSSKEVKAYATTLGRKFPLLRKFFGPVAVHMQAQPINGKTKQAENDGVKVPIDAASRRMTHHSNDSPMDDAASMINGMRATIPKAVICLGEYIIDTELDSPALQPSNTRRWHADTLPDYFDPSIRPSVPTNSRQLHFPGNKVYARWLNKDDPGSYGAVSIAPKFSHSLSTSFMVFWPHAISSLDSEVVSWCRYGIEDFANQRRI